MSARRAPVTPPTEVAKSLQRGQKRQETVVFEGISLHPPNKKRPTWRIKYNLGGKGHELSGGPTVDTAWAACLAAADSRTKRLRSSAGVPELGHVALSEALYTYIRCGGKEGRWKTRTATDRRRDFSALIKRGQSIVAEELNASHLREFVSIAGTQGRADHLLNIVSTFLIWAWKRGYLTKEQSMLADEVAWCPPSAYQPPNRGNRRQQARAFARTATGAPGGEVPTYDQVKGLAVQMQSRYEHGEGFVQAAAALGLRASELVLLTASEDIAMQGRGNIVDHQSSEVRVRFQMDSADDATLPKGTKIRDVVIPLTEHLGTNFDLREWLATRSVQALVEQRQGRNPFALIFPSPKGKAWNYSNLNNRVVTPSLDALGWKMASYQTAHGRTITPRRFTLHSMRDRFATTAINEWGYTEEQLLEQGSWSDPETVRKYYAGLTDDTHSSVRALHGLQNT